MLWLGIEKKARRLPALSLALECSISLLVVLVTNRLIGLKKAIKCERSWVIKRKNEGTFNLTHPL
jgi:hypothetical protein